MHTLMDFNGTSSRGVDLSTTLDDLVARQRYFTLNCTVLLWRRYAALTQLSVCPNAMKVHQCMYTEWVLLHDLDHSLARTGSVSSGMCPPPQLKIFVFLNLESCHFVNTIGTSPPWQILQGILSSPPIPRIYVYGHLNTQILGKGHIKGYCASEIRKLTALK